MSTQELSAQEAGEGGLRLTREPGLDELLMRLGDLPGKHLLDVVDGGSANGITLAQMGATVTALGESSLARGSLSEVAGIRRQGCQERLTIVDGCLRDDLPEGPFDAALLTKVLHRFTLQEVRQVLQGLSEVIKPGGWLLTVAYLRPDKRRDSIHPVGGFLPLSSGFVAKVLMEAGFVPKKQAPGRSDFGPTGMVLAQLPA